MNHVIWNQLLAVADKLNESNQAEQNSKKLLIEQLESIEISHDRSFDPVDNFEEYVAINLCKAIKNKLEQN